MKIHMDIFNSILVKWVMRKYKTIRSKKRAIKWLAEIAQRDEKLFAKGFCCFT